MKSKSTFEKGKCEVMKLWGTNYRSYILWIYNKRTAKYNKYDLREKNSISFRISIQSGWYLEINYSMLRGVCKWKIRIIHSLKTILGVTLNCHVIGSDVEREVNLNRNKTFCQWSGSTITTLIGQKFQCEINLPLQNTQNYISKVLVALKAN